MRNSLPPVTKFHNSDPGVGVARGATKCHALTALKPKCDARPQATLSPGGRFSFDEQRRPLVLEPVELDQLEGRKA